MIAAPILQPVGGVGFRTRLLVAMMLVVCGITAAVLFVTQRNAAVAFEQELQRQFQAELNAVHGILDLLAIDNGEISGAQIFANGDGGQGAVRLLGGRALWNMVHLTVPSLADYRERMLFIRRSNSSRSSITRLCESAYALE